MIDRNALITLIRLAISVAGNQRKLAHEWSVSESYISDVLCGTREPGKKILEALGYERVVRYQRKNV
jgi:DNA-binding transcriptional regulator YdaS (Cro superfamily)